MTFNSEIIKLKQILIINFAQQDTHNRNKKT